MGCSGQNVDGRWAGRWPYDDALDCRTQIFPNGRFELVCKDNVWVGVGNTTRQGDELTFSFVALTHQGQALKDPAPVGIRITESAGNRMRVRFLGSDLTAEWNRRLPAADQTRQ